MGKNTINTSTSEQPQVALNLEIADRPYVLKVEQANEQKLHQLCSDINESVSQFQENYVRHDKQDGLAMTALTYAAELDKAQQLLKQQHSFALSARIQKLLQRLDAMLDE